MSGRVTIDSDACIGCETCVDICPEVFRMNDETDLAEVILAEGGPEEQIEEAIESCPVECIRREA